MIYLYILYEDKYYEKKRIRGIYKVSIEFIVIIER